LCYIFHIRQHFKIDFGIILTGTSFQAFDMPMLFFILPLGVSTGDGQNNGNTKQSRNIICVNYVGRTSDSNIERSSICLHCSAGVSALVTVLTGHVK
jgi:hypothetical protein